MGVRMPLHIDKVRRERLYSLGPKCWSIIVLGGQIEFPSVVVTKRVANKVGLACEH